LTKKLESAFDDLCVLTICFCALLVALAFEVND
jgi:hypothetical protein